MRRYAFRIVVLVLSLGAVLAWWYWPETPAQRVHRLLRGFDRLPRGKLDFSFFNLFVSSKALHAEWSRLGPEAVPALVEALNNDRYPMRYLAAERLAEIGDPTALTGLIQALQDYDFGVRMWAAHALGAMRASEGVEPLIHRLEDQESCVRRAAAKALGQCRDKRAVEPLIRLLHDEEWWTRVQATVALGSLGDRRAIDPIRQLLERDNTDSIRQEGQKAMSKLGADRPAR
jgi:HEAT repeat protein